MRRFRQSTHARNELTDGRHRFEHWFRDNQIYFITARCRGKFNAFASDEAKQIFWSYLEILAKEHDFTLIVVSLLSNHYHILGYARSVQKLKAMMQHLHGAVAKLVNDLLEERLVPFWSDSSSGKKTYFDGCIRDELQCRRAFRYTLTQCKRHHICANPKDYPDTRVYVDVDRAVKRALELKAFLTNVPYARYERKRSSRSQSG